MAGSFLRITLANRVYVARVISFSSDLQATMNTVQTQNMLQHFPFRVTQSSLQLTLQTRNRREAEYLQRLVRSEQRRALSISATANFFWPERGMLDWTGVILSCQAGERVGDTSPTVTLDIMLVDSLASERTWARSRATDFENIYAGEIPDIPMLDPSGRNAPTTMAPPRPVTVDGERVQGPYLGPDGVWR